MVQRLGEVAAIYLARRGVAGVLLHLRRANTPGADYDWKHFAVVCAAIVKMTKEQRLEAFKGRAVYEIMRCLVTLSVAPDTDFRWFWVKFPETISSWTPPYFPEISRKFLVICPFFSAAAQKVRY